jgi:hypothetical protein
MPFQKNSQPKMTDRCLLYAILKRFPLQNGLLDTDTGKITLDSALLFQ